jgi:7-cyano-7-deazaguanine synthase
MDLLTGETIDLPREQPNRAIVICSGGLDSTAVAGYAAKQHEEILLLHFDYGCRATSAEQVAIKKIAEFLECPYKIVPLSYMGMLGGSPLLDNEQQISQGKVGAEYAYEWVPARNFLFLAYTTAFAEANDYGYIYLGTNLEEAGAYPDNEEQFILDVNACLTGAIQNGKKLEIRTPLGNLMKPEIVKFGGIWNSPLGMSYSCYEGGEEHCGTCGPCTMRKIAFQRAGIEDPTKYLNDADEPF